MSDLPDPQRIAFLGDYLPQRCGISTFTHDLCEAVACAAPDTDFFVGAVNDRPEGYLPNAVYSCGSLIHGSRLILPDSVSDFASATTSIQQDDLLAALQSN